MIALRLVRLIESHSDELVTQIVTRLQTSARTSGMRKVPVEELRERSYEILRHINEWLLTKPEADIQQRYVKIGERRAAQGVPLADYCRATILTKQILWDFLQRQGFLRGPVELYGEIELLQPLNQFFDSALCYAADGFEQYGGEPTRLGEGLRRLAPACD